MSHELNERQRKMLEAASEKRRNMAKRAGLVSRGDKVKPKVSPQEYHRRLNEMLKEDNRIAQESHKRRVEKAMEEWSKIVGPRFSESSFENPRVRELVMTKINRIENHGPLHRNGLVLSGKLGVGKTWTAYSYARELVSRGLLLPSSLVHGTESSLLTPLALAGFERPQKVFSFLNSNNKFYLIDEVGRANIKPEIRHEIWYELINHAYENHVPIVLTTNLSTANFRMQGSNRTTNELEIWIGEAAYDRLKYIADVIIPSNENKRAQAGRLMDEGKVLGFGEEPESQKDEDDPFAGMPVSGNKTSEPPVRRSSMKVPVNDLRPQRRKP